MKQLNDERLEQIQLAMEIATGGTFLIVWFAPIFAWLVCGPLACLILCGFELRNRQQTPPNFAARLAAVGCAVMVVIIIAVMRVF